MRCACGGLTRHGGLSHSDPRYIETLRRGTTIYMALVPAYLTRLAISEFADVPDGPLAAMCSVAELIAAWMISTQDPRGLGMDPGSARRRWLRAAAGGAAVLGVLRALVEALGLSSAGGPGLEALDLVASVLGVVIVYLAFARYASIARRLPDARWFAMHSASSGGQPSVRALSRRPWCFCSRCDGATRAGPCGRWSHGSRRWLCSGC